MPIEYIDMVKLVPSVTAEVVPGGPIPALARWQLRSLYIDLGPYQSMAERERLAARVVGSADWLWSGADDLCFDRSTLLLTSARFRVPEVNLEPPASLAAWQAAPVQPGGLRLLAGQSFTLEPVDLRWLDEQGSVLIGATSAALSGSANKLRLRIGPDLDLLFADGQLCGWLLEHPARHLVEAWEAPVPDSQDVGLPALVCEYLMLIAEPHIDALDEQDPALLATLTHLHTRVGRGGGPGSGRQVLRVALEDIVETFYDRTLSGG